MSAHPSKIRMKAIYIRIYCHLAGEYFTIIETWRYKTA